MATIMTGKERDSLFEGIYSIIIFNFVVTVLLLLLLLLLLIIFCVLSASCRFCFYFYYYQTSITNTQCILQCTVRAYRLQKVYIDY